jgi:cytochrome c
MKLFVSTAVAAAALAAIVFAQAPEAEKLIKGSDCASCHASDRQVVGPSYASISKKYAGQSDAADKLSAKIRDGGNGMTPHPSLSDAQRRDIAQWILAVKESGSGQADSKTYTYTSKSGAAVQLDFPLFAEGKAPKVTKEVFHGYQLYNSYCYRCHGTDASDSQLAPDLRRSLQTMKQQEFLSIAMSGKKEKGMPEWAGFLSEDDVVHIYRYVKGRSTDLVPSGRPASEQD